MKRIWPRVALMALDAVVALVAVVVAFALRFDGDIPVSYLMVYVKVLPVAMPLRLVIYYAYGLYRQMWSHASVPELLRVVYAVLTDAALTGLIVFVLPYGYPRSILVIGALLQVAALACIRLALRLRYEWLTSQPAAAENSQKTLIFGAGDAGVLLAREFAKHPELNGEIVGFVDDDPHKQGYYIGGKPVLGTRAELADVVKDHGVTQLIVAAPSISRTVIREVLETGHGLGLRLKTLPGLFELVGGQVSVSQVRDVQIEDLLGRDEIRVDLEGIAAYLSGETVLITGAGGSIGSELCRQVSRYGPARLVLLGHGENSIYEIHQELRQRFSDLELDPVIADIQDTDRINRIFERLRPTVIFHAAAHKHVPLMELNPEEAIKNNVLGTWNVARAADKYGAKRFVLISSDKAVNPTSVMGATKRAAECVVQSLARTSQTIFVAVRFGNVLGSRGSVVPLFKKQIAAGGPVTVTDPRMVRYFMTIPEAVQLVIQAAALGQGGEIFVLDMGQPVRIDQLARDLIRLSGLEPDVDIRIVYSGIRPGEKLYEELLTAGEGTVTTRHERIFRARGDSIPLPVLQSLIATMEGLAATDEVDPAQVRGLVEHFVAEVIPHGDTGTGC